MESYHSLGVPNEEGSGEGRHTLGPPALEPTTPLVIEADQNNKFGPGFPSSKQ
jgi:hypothetical protein